MADKNSSKKGGLRKWLGLGGVENDETVQDSSGESQYVKNYQLRQEFLSEREISFFQVLKKMIGGRLLIFPKVSLSDIFSNSGSDVSQHQDKVKHKTVDFLLCDPDSFKPVLALYLEQVSLPDSEQVDKDEMVEAVFECVGLPLVKVQVMESYNISELARTFRQAIENTLVGESMNP